MIPHCAKNFQKILAVYISLSPPFSPQKAAISINKQKKRRSKDRRLVLALSIFPGRCQPSIVDRNELNYRVRNGNGWTLILISTNYMSSSTARKQTILYCPSHLLSRHFLSGDPYRIRTDVNGVRGRCLNHLTNGPCLASWGPHWMVLPSSGMVHLQGLEPWTP